MPNYRIPQPDRSSLIMQRQTDAQQRSYQGPIVVSGDDYAWDQQRSNPRHPHISENPTANLSAATVTASRNHDGLNSHWDQQRSDPRHAHISENANANANATAATVTAARTPSFGVHSFWDQQRSDAAPSFGESSHTGITDSSPSFALANLSIAEGANHSIAESASQRKDAAKTAATYYGECYLEGVEMGYADKAARESHDRYKKWWLQENHSEGMMSSFGDGIKVPMYNPPSPSPLPSTAEEQSAMEQEPNEIMRESSAGYYTVEDSALDMPESHSGPELMMHDAARVFNRSSGASHPSPVDNASFLSNQQFAAAGDYASEDSPNSVRKKRQRSFTSSKRAPYYQSKSKPRELPTANDHGHGIDTYATTDDEAAGGMTIHTMETRCGFERARSKRLEQQRRGSSFCDYEYAPHHSRHSAMRRSVLDKRKGAQGYKKSMEYHSSKSVERHPSIDEELMYDRCKDSEKYDAIMTSVMPPVGRTAKHIDNAKLELLRYLAISGGDITNKPFLFALEQLRALYVMTDFDARFASPGGDKHLEGNWLTISRPNFSECLGTNTNGDYMYTLGRMSFDMFAPGNLVCSISGIFNSIQVESSEKCIGSVPKSLRDEVTKGNTILRRYDLVTAFKIEPDSPLFGSHSPNRNVHRPLRGIITTYGHVLPDPKKRNRLSIWFSGGKIEPSAEQQDLELWKKAFGGGILKRQLQEKARILAAKLLLGATVPSAIEEDGSMEFVLGRPIGGHGSAYVDVLYLDDNLRIVQGQRGSLFVMTRVSS
mmetsp:Transcript_15706/g.23413  ORF Transcript_15706/g.23413 Transcript_15706/m.23413 type:complete len:772 (+) Transcript_15706:97-2412(+)